MADEKAEQQANTEIDPRPDREEEQAHGRLHDPSFIGTAVQGGEPPQSDVSSPESDALIVPRPSHGPVVMARSGLIVHPARDHGAVKLSRTEPLDMNRLEPNSQAVPQRPAKGCVGSTCPPGNPRRPIISAGQCAFSVVHHAARAIRPYSMPLLGGGCIEAEVRKVVCSLWETLVAVVACENRQ